MTPPARPIAIVGRPNVGKSTLFNRLIGERKAVISPVRGTTRDQLDGLVRWRGRQFLMSDTGGFEPEPAPGLPEDVQRQLRRTVDEATQFVLVVDGPQGVTAGDRAIVDALRQRGKSVILAVNKQDHRPVIDAEFYALGIDDVIPVSGLHGRGIGELLDRILDRWAPAMEDQAPQPGPRAMQVAIVGRQNVGKSSFVNAVLREERVVVSEVPGTTRDAVDLRLLLDGEPVVLVDTAGLRHKRKVRHPVDIFSMSRSIEALNRCDVALLILDATQGATRDDQRIVTQIARIGCALVVLLNKWDLVPKPDVRGAEATIHRLMPGALFAPVVPVSAKTGFQVKQAMATARRIFRASRGPLISDEECSRLLLDAWKRQPPTRYRGRPLLLRTARIRAGRPVTVELDLRPVGWLPGSYQHYLVKQLYKHPKLAGLPIHVTPMGPKVLGPSARKR